MTEHPPVVQADETQASKDLLEHMSRAYCKHYGFDPDSLNFTRKKYWTVFAARFKRLSIALSARGYVLARKMETDR